MEANELKRLIYRSWHRGCKETDILLGDYAKAELESLNSAELSAYSRFIEENDWDIYEWILNSEASPPEIYIGLIAKIRAFSSRKNTQI